MSWSLSRSLRLGLIVAAVAATVACEGGYAGGDAAVPEQVDGISDVVLQAYGQAAEATDEFAPECSGMTWAILAGIGQEESHHGTLNGSEVGSDGLASPPIIGPQLNGEGPFAAIEDTDGGLYDNDTEWDRAVGPMQFIPATWEAWAPTATGVEEPDPQDMVAAARTAAAYICGTDEIDLTDEDTLRERLRAYNNSDVYVDDVMDNIAEYESIPVASANPAGAGAGATGAAGTAITWATSHEGSPYVWGGSCMDPQQELEGERRAATPQDEYNNCDCSSLVQQAYAQADVELARTTSAQWAQEDLLTIDAVHGQGSGLSEQDLAVLQPGDLMYFVTNAPGPAPTHVGMYLGGTDMVHAPNSDKDIEVIDMAEEMGGYYMGGGAPYWGSKRVTG